MRKRLLQGSHLGRTAEHYQVEQEHVGPLWEIDPSNDQRPHSLLLIIACSSHSPMVSGSDAEYDVRSH